MTAISDDKNTSVPIGILSHLRVGQRVRLGFTLALGIAFTGSLVGMSMGEYYERQTRATLAQAIAQAQLISQVKDSTYAASIHQRSLVYLVSTPSILTETLNSFRTDAEAVHQALGALQAGYHDADLTPEMLTAYNNVNQAFEQSARPYFRETQLQILAVESLELTPGDADSQSRARALLLETNQESSLLAMQRFIESLEQLANLLETDKLAATDQLKATAILRQNIVAASLVLSLIIASLFALLITRSIVRPLKQVEEVAQAITKGNRFDLQAPITTRDEVATLASALNQLIERVRSLLASEHKRTAALTQANQEILATQTQMIAQEKLASLGALTAGIAHEIKNPLNFVNNFAELSVELADELTAEIALVQAQIEPERAEEIADILGTLRSNVAKIEHHGKRADKIVGNMLMHSRSGTVEWSAIAINDLLAEALNLAYHGMRAKHSDFNLTFDTDYDDSLETIDGCAQDLNRVFLNIANNACYAIYQRSLTAGPEFVPLLKVRTRNCEHYVEITLRDNGTGMPAEVRDKIFDQFFTTKPTGEGTGLGLSLSYDIITQQHKGSLSVASEVGLYTDFVITLPKRRDSNND